MGDDFRTIYNNLNIEWKKDFDAQCCEELRKVEYYEKVKRFIVRNERNTDISILLLLPKLEELIIHIPVIKPWEQLLKFQNLKKLYIPNTIITDISFLKELKKLKTLCIRNTKVTDISSLPYFTALQNLDIEGTDIFDYEPLIRCKKLNELTIKNPTAKQLLEIGKLNKLKVLEINGKVPSIEFIRGMTSLERVQLNSDDCKYELLASLPNIKELIIPYIGFAQTKDLFDKKISYSIIGYITDDESEVYSEYVHGK